MLAGVLLIATVALAQEEALEADFLDFLSLLADSPDGLEDPMSLESPMINESDHAVPSLKPTAADSAISGPKQGRRGETDE